ncbi:sepiapterin reductase [Teleopsis dalmanni]|uniref:sepiapterin reductase-like n=1 Tax=Teleopsis dalmanni TaxID=139649 RepID=UPI0018CCAAFC|nr:sepiapterin reductase-like [Teleopsis dalmanni]XP_037930371.1 sepiapterin reductase-like [Teleopsis dalmanni]XP_037937776.1 sepiapterin reductase-like [Teleopsis dalmanni]XP_037937853.1 sepiapterin reductase [Teleopsis dalmanni]
MASKRFDLYKRCFFILSGISNPLGKTLTIEMCRRFKAGSVAVLIDDSEENLQELKKELEFLENDVEIVCCDIGDWQKVSGATFREILAASVNNYIVDDFELAFILHNEGLNATSKLIEPQIAKDWKLYVQENLYAPVALNQEFLRFMHFDGVKKLCVNITSSLQVKPIVYSSLMGSCKKARDMYFRAMAAEEGRNGVTVLNYMPGILATHEPELDVNGNLVEVNELNMDETLLNIPRVRPIQTTLKLINILEDMSFISGHDLDYYDTYVL